MGTARWSEASRSWSRSAGAARVAAATTTQAVRRSGKRSRARALAEAGAGNTGRPAIARSPGSSRPRTVPAAQVEDGRRAERDPAGDRVQGAAPGPLAPVLGEPEGMEGVGEPAALVELGQQPAQAVAEDVGRVHVGVGEQPVGDGDDHLGGGRGLQGVESGAQLRPGDVLDELAAEDDVDGVEVVGQAGHRGAHHPVVGAGGLGLAAQGRVVVDAGHRGRPPPQGGAVQPRPAAPRPGPNPPRPAPARSGRPSARPPPGRGSAG